METIGLYSLFSIRAELQSLMATELRNLDSFALKGVMMQGIEDARPKQ